MCKRGQSFTQQTSITYFCHLAVTSAIISSILWCWIGAGSCLWLPSTFFSICTTVAVRCGPRRPTCPTSMNWKTWILTLYFVEAHISRQNQNSTKILSFNEARLGWISSVGHTLNLSFKLLTLFDISFFLVHLTWGGAQGAPPGKHTSGTFMSSNDLVSHQTHKNG